MRESRPNATVTTLLDMFLQANPGKAKLDEEKEEIAKKYSPGDAVLPVEQNETGSGEQDEEDRRLMEEVTAMSLREVGIGDQSSTSSSQDGQSFRHRQVRNAGSGERADNERNRRQRDDRGVRRQTRQQAGRSSGGTDGMAARSRTARQIGHQASLRSLLSTSDKGKVTIEEEILRQIVEEGLLDGIDLDSLDQAQEEELSERIAEAYRRRHQHRVDSQRRSSENAIRPRESDHRRSRSQSQTAHDQSTATATESSRQPPVSQPQRLQPAGTDPASRGHQRRASDQGNRRRETSPALVNHESSSNATLRPAARSSSDITNQRHRPQTGKSKTREPLSVAVPRRATESESNVPRAWSAITRTGRQTGTSIAATTGETQISSKGSRPAPLPGSSLLPRDPLRPERSAASRPSSSHSNASRVSPRLYPEPSISCDRCGRSGIQYDLHKNCSECHNGNYNLCLRCYRQGQGCLRWSGFGPSGQSKLEQRPSPPGQSNNTSESFHILRSQRYRRPAETASRSLNDGRELTSDNPANRIEDGLFCDICLSLSNECFFQCSRCNEGEWGFCRRCVNQGKCCTHPLFPIRRIQQESAAPSAGSTRSPPSVPVANESYDVLSFFTKCDICTSAIPPSVTRYHCPTCNDGDYDVCTNCYLKLVASGKISKENGHSGWRRCINGHRMIVVGFEDFEHGQRRVVVRDLVGGHTFKDSYVQPQGQNQSSAGKGAAIISPELGSGEWYWKDGSERRKKASRTRTNSNINGPETGPPSSPTIAPPVSSARRFPPDGGMGLVVLAMWSYYPDDDVKDELLFPRGAEITETENVNDEWFWGYYAGTTGLFPGTYGRVIREVS